MATLAGTLRVALSALAVAVLPASCDSGEDSTQSPAVNNSARGAAVTYLLLRAPGWSLDGGDSAESIPGGLAFGGIWLTSYESRAEPNRSLGAALMLAKPNRGARSLASKLGTVTDVRVGDASGVAVEEHSPKAGHFIATHVLWMVGDHVAWFTAYDVRTAEAVELAQSVERVGESEWRSATGRANERRLQ